MLIAFSQHTSIPLVLFSSMSMSTSHWSVGEVQDLHTLTATLDRGGTTDGGLFSAVVVEDTLEFVLHPAAVLRRVWEHLKPGGFLYVVQPYIDVPDAACVRR